MYAKNFKVQVATVLVQSNVVYKGAFETSAELNEIGAYAGDYADVYETNSRWQFKDGDWVDTGQTILINPLIATNEHVSEVAATLNTKIDTMKNEINLTNERVAKVEQDIANPILIISKI